MRFLRRLTLVALLAVLFAWLRKVLSEEVLKRSPEAQAPTPPVGRDPAPKPAPPADVASKPAGNGAEPTKAELYERAQELGIEGRSKMSKAELQREISRRD